MNLREVKDWLKTLNIAEHYHVGKLDAKKEKSVGVYDRRDKLPDRITYGGYDNVLYEVLPVSILIHWNGNGSETDIASCEIVEKLRELRGGGYYIGNYLVAECKMMTKGAVNVGTDANKIYEAVIWLDIYYNKNL